MNTSIEREEIDTRITRLKSELKRHFPSASSNLFVVDAPLRICPLGAHIDHQGGTVTGFTINRSIKLIGAPISQPVITLRSLHFGETVSVPLQDPGPSTADQWANYLRGSINSLNTYRAERALPPLRQGFCGVVDAEMPIGGLSSSAAVIIAYLKALLHVNSAKCSTAEMIKLVLQTENNYLGLHNGILNQSVILNSVPGELTIIDCLTENISRVPLPENHEDWEILIVYSGLSRNLIASPYNQRVAECRQAAKEILTLAGQVLPEKLSLGAIALETFQNYSHSLPKISALRAAHFFGELDRVRKGIEAWKNGDLQRFGQLVTASGRSSIDNYQSGSPPLVTLYELLADQKEVYGTRFCGGGFKGCCMAIIEPPFRNTIAESIHQQYPLKYPQLKSAYSIHSCLPNGKAECSNL